MSAETPTETTTLLGQQECAKINISSSDEAVQAKIVNPSKDAQSIPNRIKIIVLCILFTEFAESIAFYSIAANLILFANTHLGFTNTQAATLSFIYVGTGYALPILSGYLADSHLGQYNTMYLGGLIYIAGILTVFLMTVPYQLPFSTSAKTSYFIVGLILVAIGTGGIKSNISPFGASQLESCGPVYVQRFFAWFYFSLNLGSLISFTVVAYIQQNVSFFYGFMIPSIAMILAVAVFASARKYYELYTPKGSLLGEALSITYQSFKVRLSKRTNIIDKSNIQSFFDYAKKENGGKFDAHQVNRIKPLGRVIPVFLLIVLFRTVYFQMSTTWFIQGESMNLQLGNIKLPVALLSTFDIISVMIFIPVVNYGVYPAYQKIFGKRISRFRRMGTGMVFAALAMLVAGIVESNRLKNVYENPLPQTVSGKTFNASANITVLAQVPQFALIGLGETFTSVTGFEFAYSEAPEELKGIMTGLYLLAIGLGGFIGPLVITIINAITYDPKVVNSKWIPKNTNNGHLDYYFYFLAGISYSSVLIK
ncbi:uncharacterized protein TRIADDRAFT_31599 [Trichoplax adhaerens]|uniref:Major facilitator superfamily (MFS) profile domain-containing protein n=1 Tax=Trichoplax adhaerens TaxID=10228 RepID=B3S9B4_TRIAD|nr:hypothetical protein TRIADDRAFT_31599 [Trichoplax adhaerens]EDV20617.1 hypothetical protein TRIADDRAFT_31599 [Trichoplax adhaerens]|eukprot:XP_002116817.1 hypothetical protein TRIADDRAFT_31599 [Trichoplax adhaerens]